MSKKLISGVLAAALMTAPAMAGSIDDQVDLCAAAAVAEGHVTDGEFRAKFVDMKGASVKRLTIQLISFNGDDTKTVTCKIRRGEVTEVSLPTA